jgi:hypothetical protein
MVVGGHVLAGVVGGLLSLLGTRLPQALQIALPAMLFLPGATQLLWVVPLSIWAGVTGRASTLRGILITAGLVFLLNAACWGGMLVLMGAGSMG